MTRARRLLWPAVAAALVAAGGFGVWRLTRGPDLPAPPEPDLSRSEPEVAAAVREAIAQVRQNPKDGPAWGKLGMVLRAHDFDAESVAALRTAERLDPAEYRWPYLAGLTLVLTEPDAGVECLRRAAERAPRSRPEPKLRLAEVLLERGKADEADRLVAEVLAAQPDNPRANWLAARAAADRGDWSAALDRAGRCRSDQSCAKKAALLRGEALAHRGDPAAADAELRAAAAAPADAGWPDPVVEQVRKLRVGTAARLAQATALLEQGDVRAAVDVLRDAVRHAPDDPEPRLVLGQTLNRARDPADALPVLTELTAKFPDSVEGWFQLGVARFLLGKPTEAVEAFRKVTALKPDHALAYFNLGHCYRKLGDRPAARAAYEQALRCRPDYEPARQALAQLDAGK